LVELMIAAGLLAGLTIVFLQLTKQQNNSSRDFAINNEIEIIRQDIANFMKDSQACGKTMTSDGTAVFDSVTFKKPVTKIFKYSPPPATAAPGTLGTLDEVERYKTLPYKPGGVVGLKLTGFEAKAIQPVVANKKIEGSLILNFSRSIGDQKMRRDRRGFLLQC